MDFYFDNPLWALIGWNKSARSPGSLEDLNFMSTKKKVCLSWYNENILVLIILFVLSQILIPIGCDMKR